jgi:2-keto-3-deoxy-L-rhamnonate aldolase RhmA
MDNAKTFATRLRSKEKLVGYWAVMGTPVAMERVARVGYDYICFDQQHGLMGYQDIRDGLMAVDAGSTLGPVPTIGLVRAAANDITWIGHALDAGAAGIIVPLVDSAEDAARAVANTKYPPLGRRSFGPMRSQLRIGPVPAEVNEATVVAAMIETPEGLANVEAIAATPGLDALYVGPSDLCIAVGGRFPGDPEVREVFDAALERVLAAAAAAGIAAGIHTASGAEASARLDQGFDFASVSSDLVHLEQAAADHLRRVQG